MVKLKNLHNFLLDTCTLARAKIDNPLFQAFEQRAFLLLLLHFFHQLNSSRSTVLLFAVFEKTSNFLLKNSRNLRFLSYGPNYHKMYWYCRPDSIAGWWWRSVHCPTLWLPVCILSLQFRRLIQPVVVFVGFCIFKVESSITIIT